MGEVIKYVVLTLVLTALLTSVPILGNSDTQVITCLGRDVGISEVINLPQGVLNVSIKVHAKEVEGGLNVTVSLKLSSLGGLNDIKYTPPLLDFIVVTDKGLFRWSRGKFFTQSVMIKKLPVITSESLIVRGSCIKSVVVIIKPINYFRVLGTTEFLRELLSVMGGRVYRAVNTTTVNRELSVKVITPTTVKPAPQCTAGVLVSPQSLSTSSRSVKSLTTSTATVATVITKSEVTKSLTTTQCLSSVCRAPSPPVVAKSVGLGGGAEGVKLVTKTTTVTRTETVVTSVTKAVTGGTYVSSTRYSSVVSGGAYVLPNALKLVIATAVAVVVGIVTYLILYRRSYP